MRHAWLVIVALPGCAVLEPTEDAVVNAATKYCDTAAEYRLDIRKRFNFKLGEHGHCAVVQCAGDEPVSCPFLSDQGD